MIVKGLSIKDAPETSHSEQSLLFLSCLLHVTQPIGQGLYKISNLLIPHDRESSLPSKSDDNSMNVEIAV